MPYNAIPCNIMQYYAIPCNTMQYHAIQCNNMQYHAILRNTMQYHVIPCNTMQYHASLITADGAYHCPVGSIMAIFMIDRGGWWMPILGPFSSKVVARPPCTNSVNLWKVFTHYIAMHCLVSIRSLNVKSISCLYNICFVFVLYRGGVGGKIANRAHSIGNAQSCQMAIKRDQRIHQPSSLGFSFSKDPPSSFFMIFLFKGSTILLL